MIYLLMIITMTSFVLTGCLRRYALARNIIDTPNHRSAHTIPTPRGGGGAFIMTFFLAIPYVHYLGYKVEPFSFALLGGGGLVAMLGFWDDHKGVPELIRLFGYFSASIFALYCIGGMPSISFFWLTIPTGLVLNFLALIYLVWLLNLFNFMDGIDGLAATETISVCLGAVLLYALSGHYLLMGLPLVLAASVAGFLWWNFPPARIFMGDIGSAFLGMAIGLLTIQAAGVSQQLFWSWLILLGVFIVDATVTLLFRLCQGFPIHKAHSDHAYQHAVRLLGNHFWVTFGILILNVLWLLPWAILVNNLTLRGSIGVLFAYVPLIILAIGLKAGREFDVTANAS